MRVRRPFEVEWEREKAEANDRGLDGWMASPTRWTWVWVNSGSWWWTGSPCVLRFIGSHSRTRLSELNWSTSKPMNLPNYLHSTTPFHSQLIIRCFLFYFLCISCLCLLLLFSITQSFLLAKSNDDHVSFLPLCKQNFLKMRGWSHIYLQAP